MTSPIAGTSPTPATTTSSTPTGFASLGAQDFIKMLSAQLQNQDPSKPTDNSAMVAQLAQFTSLSATTAMGSTLTQISGKLDSVIGELGKLGVIATTPAGTSTTGSPTTTA